MLERGAAGSISKDHQSSRLLLNAAWLLRLRWVAVVGQLVTIGTAALVLRVDLQLVPLLAVVLFTAVTNVAFGIWLTAQTRKVLADVSSDRAILLTVAVMTLDLFSLTGLLYFSGGTANPFTIFYFVNLALAAVLLPERWGWTLSGIVIFCLASIFVFHQTLDELNRSVRPPLLREPTTLGQIGLLVSLAACAIVVVYFITRVTRELRQRERELRTAEQQQALSRRLEALGTLAAGAGHELATPLSTIAVVSKELTRHLENVEAPSFVFDDVALIRSEVDRCRGILDRMSGNLNQGKDEELLRVSVDQLVAEVLRGIAEQPQIHIEISKDVRQQDMLVPLQSLAQAIRGVVQNALDANEAHRPVDLSATVDNGRICLSVRDHGPGMTDAVLARAGEPFFTTKEPGKGMGLGLFLTRSVIERLGGTLELRSSPEQGVTATVSIPVSGPPAGEVISDVLA